MLGRPLRDQPGVAVANAVMLAVWLDATRLAQ